MSFKNTIPFFCYLLIKNCHPFFNFPDQQYNLHNNPSTANDASTPSNAATNLNIPENTGLSGKSGSPYDFDPAMSGMSASRYRAASYRAARYRAARYRAAYAYSSPTTYYGSGYGGLGNLGGFGGLGGFTGYGGYGWPSQFSGMGYYGGW